MKNNRFFQFFPLCGFHGAAHVSHLNFHVGRSLNDQELLAVCFLIYTSISILLLKLMPSISRVPFPFHLLTWPPLLPPPFCARNKTEEWCNWLAHGQLFFLLPLNMARAVARTNGYLSIQSILYIKIPIL